MSVALSWCCEKWDETDCLNIMPTAVGAVATFGLVCFFSNVVFPEYQVVAYSHYPQDNGLYTTIDETGEVAFDTWPWLRGPQGENKNAIYRYSYKLYNSGQTADWHKQVIKDWKLSN